MMVYLLEQERSFFVDNGWGDNRTEKAYETKGVTDSPPTVEYLSYYRRCYPFLNYTIIGDDLYPQEGYRFTEMEMHT